MREIFFITRIPPVHSFSTLSSYLKIHVDISISKILSILYLFGSGSINQKFMLIRKSRALFSRLYKNKNLLLISSMRYFPTQNVIGQYLQRSLLFLKHFFHIFSKLFRFTSRSTFCTAISTDTTNITSCTYSYDVVFD